MISEYRTLIGEIRAIGQKIVGRLPYNSLSSDLGGFRERVTPTAFADALAGRESVIANINHGRDPSQPLLGTTADGTLRLFDSAKALFYEVTPPDTSYARSVMDSIRGGKFGGSSFQFRLKNSGDSWGTLPIDGSLVRDLRAVQLIDVCPVDQPAYPTSRVYVRDYSGSDFDAAEAYLEPEDNSRCVFPDVARAQIRLKELAQTRQSKFIGDHYTVAQSRVRLIELAGR
jgi:HK97 family phage prohead protease